MAQRYIDIKNGQVFVPQEKEETAIDYSGDIMVNSLRDKINKYNLVQELFTKP